MLNIVNVGLRSTSDPILRSLATMTTSTIRNGGHAAIIQLTSTSDKISNFNRSKALIETAVSNHNASVVFLPEAFDFIGESTIETLQLAESIDGPLITQYRDLAKNLKIEHFMFSLSNSIFSMISFSYGLSLLRFNSEFCLFWF